MKLSTHHKHFATDLNCYLNINEQDVLDHPENYLGPNYREVLNLWFYWGSLSEEKWDVLDDRYYALDKKTRDKAREISKELAKEVIDSRFVVWLCVWELEIIAAHLYFQRSIPFTHLPLIFDL